MIIALQYVMYVVTCISQLHTFCTVYINYLQIKKLNNEKYFVICFQIKACLHKCHSVSPAVTNITYIIKDRFTAQCLGPIPFYL